MNTQYKVWVAGLWFGISVSGCTLINDFGEFHFDDVETNGGIPQGKCQGRCLGDATADFGTSQPAGTLQWRYLIDTRDPRGVSQVSMGRGNWEGIDGWVDASKNPGAAIVSCNGSNHSSCDSKKNSLVFVPDGPGAGGRDPTIQFTAPRTDRYRIAGAMVAGTPTRSIEPFEITFSRNSRNDVVARGIDFVPSSDLITFSFDIELIEGDRGLMTLSPSATAVAVSSAEHLWMRVYEGREGSAQDNADCLFALTFEGSAPWTDACKGAIVENRNSLGGSLAVAVPSVTSGYGSALELRDRQYVRSAGAPMDYRGDFTIQFWVKYAGTDNYSEAFYSDLAIVNTIGGVEIGPYNHQIYATVVSPDEGECNAENVIDGNCIRTANGNMPSDMDWHFYRVVRDISLDQLSVCIDGREVGSVEVPADINFTGSASPHIGQASPELNLEPVFDGAIDDVRIFRRALPCITPP